MTDEKKVSLEDLKLIHDIYAVTHQILTQKCMFHHEEFEFVGKTVEFYKKQIATVRKQIEDLEELEKKAVEEAKDGEDKSEG